MGMLEIRRSSAKLNNLGSFRMPELDNGSARAFAAQAEAAKSAAAAARVAGHAKMEGIMRRGQIVARTLGDLGRMAVELANRENERIATNAVLQSENDRNLYMTGDGTPENPGQLNIRQGKDGEWHAEEWLNDIKHAAEARRERFTKDLNGPQRRMYDEMVAKRDVAWNARIFAHAAKTTLDAEIATATAALAQAKEKAIGDFDVGAARESSIQEMYDAKEREMNARQVPESLRAAEMKALTEDFLVNFAKTKFTTWENETFDSADPEAVAKTWNEKGDALQRLKGKVIDSEAVKEHLGGGELDKVRQELLKKEFNTHRSAAIARAYTLQREVERKQLQDIDLQYRGAVASEKLADVENALNGMDARAKKLEGDKKTKGSRVHVAAMEAAVRLNKTADELAQYQIMDDLVAGNKPEYKNDPRKERLFPAVKQAFDARREREFTKAFRAAHGQNLLVARQMMLEFAAQNNPQGYLNWLAGEVAKEDPTLTVNDFATLRNEFQNGWMKGFKGHDQQMPKQMELAGSLLDIMKDRLGVDYAASVKRDASGALQLDKLGLLQADEKAEDRPSIKYSRDTGGWFNSTERLGPDDILTLLNDSLIMAMNDGAEVPFDPVSGERLPEGKLHRVNAVQDFAARIDHLKDEKKVLSAARELANRNAYMTNVRSWTAAAETDRTTRIAKSKTVRGGEDEGEEKEEK
jgi:hypothetical protein